MLGRREVTPDVINPCSKKRKLDFDDLDVYKLKCAFIRVNFRTDPELPKSKLIAYCGSNRIKVPTYQIINEDKLFRAIATLEGKKYTSTYW